MLKYAYQIGYLVNASEYNEDDEGLNAAGEERKKAACVAENTANDGTTIISPPFPFPSALTGRHTWWIVAVLDFQKRSCSQPAHTKCLATTR